MILSNLINTLNSSSPKSSLLFWLKKELKDKVDITEPGAGDRSCFSELEWEGNNYLIGSAAFYEEGDDSKAELDWMLQAHKHRSIKEKLFGKN